jgi:hypothetical protein
MLSVQEPTVAPYGHGAVGIVLDNYDRDPLGLDIDELRQSVRVGLGRGWELHGSYYFSRAVTIPGGHSVPPAPLDILVASGPAPSLPYRTNYWPLPYVGRRSSSVGEMIPGDIVVGLKRQMIHQRGLLPAISASMNAILPATETPRNLHRGSGSGSFDVALHIATGWTVNRWSVALNGGFIRSGTLPYVDRIVSAGGSTDIRIRRPHFIRVAAGIRYGITRRISLMTEWFHLRGIGDTGNTDVLAGLQVHAWKCTFIAGYRQHLDPQRNKIALPTGPLAGAIDLSHVPTAERNSYLLAVHAPYSYRPEASIIVTGVPDDALIPAQAFRISDAYPTSTSGNGGSILLIGFRF